jgi:outer membrane biosynthesis protein TonB
MTIKNITKNANISAVGQILTPGIRKNMPVEYYAKRKYFIDGLVLEKKASITGMEEYEAYKKNMGQSSEPEIKPEPELEPKTKPKTKPKSKPKSKPKTKPKQKPKE